MRYLTLRGPFFVTVRGDSDRGVELFARGLDKP